MLMPFFKQKISIFALCIFSFSVFAAKGHVYLGTSLGADFATLGHHAPSISYANHSITDNYPLKSHLATSPLLSINSGYEFYAEKKTLAIAWGLGLYRNLAEYGYNGHVTETAAGDTPNTLYNNSYHIYSSRLMAELQLTWMFKTYAPFINLGVGSVWNQLQGYTEVPINNSGYAAQPPFQSHTNIHLAYQAGLGVARSFNFKGSTADYQKERIAVGYRYANLGVNTFGTRGSSYPYALNTGSFNSNNVYLGYIHLF